MLIIINKQLSEYGRCLTLIKMIEDNFGEKSLENNKTYKGIRQWSID